MRGSLGATLTDVAWVITAYAIANVIVIPMTSWLSQQFRDAIILPFLSYIRSPSFMPLIYGSWLLFGLFKGLVVLLLVTAQTIITESYPIKRGMEFDISLPF
jgi:DHA2 family multidrug resistance protein